MGKSETSIWLVLEKSVITTCSLQHLSHSGQCNNSLWVGKKKNLADLERGNASVCTAGLGQTRIDFLHMTMMQKEKSISTTNYTAENTDLRQAI